MSYSIVTGAKGISLWQDAINTACKEWIEDRYLTMRQDMNGEELSTGDRILVCYEKDYGWLGYATITGETSLTWRIDFDNPNVHNRQRNFDKNPKRILKVA